jgi:hypothetical protein
MEPGNGVVGLVRSPPERYLKIGLARGKIGMVKDVFMSGVLSVQSSIAEKQPLGCR